jgi:hypothetical protein
MLDAQSYLANGSTGISAFAAWDLTTGVASTVVAVVDTGVVPHADLAGRVLFGYDFVTDPTRANDGGGRDADAADPGDWISSADTSLPIFGDCDIAPSSWHGTAIAGIIASNTDNAQWTAGINWVAKILPVRVLGKCDGMDSEILDGVAWAAGLAVPGAPPNPSGQVINLTRGFRPCGSVSQRCRRGGGAWASAIKSRRQQSEDVANAPARTALKPLRRADDLAGNLALQQLRHGITLRRPAPDSPGSPRA